MSVTIPGDRLGFKPWIAVLTVVSMALGGAVAAGEDAPTGEANPSAQATPAPGFWPNEALIEASVRNTATIYAKRFGLREDQRLLLEKGLQERVPQFLDKHRAAIQPVLNELLTASADTPVDAAKLQDWGERLGPVFDDFKQVYKQSQDELSETLTPEQEASFAREREQTQARFAELDRMLERWREGKGKPEDLAASPLTRGLRKPREDADSPELTGAGDKKAKPSLPPIPAPGKTLDATWIPERLRGEFDLWRQFVQQFAEAHAFDRSQRLAAESILVEMLDRAETYVRLHRDEIREVEVRLRAPNGMTAEEFSALASRVYGPLDTLFGELKERVTRLATPHQLRQAAQKAAPESGSSFPTGVTSEKPESAE